MELVPVDEHQISLKVYGVFTEFHKLFEISSIPRQINGREPSPKSVLVNKKGVWEGFYRKVREYRHKLRIRQVRNSMSCLQWMGYFEKNIFER